MTLFVLEYLSFPTATFASFFNVPNSFPYYITAIIFRMIANQHLYNPAISHPDQKHFLINKIHDYFTTIFIVNNEGELVCTSRVCISYKTCFISNY